MTRRAVLALSAETGLAVDERRFTLDEAFAAAEAFYTSASSFVMPVVSIDGHAIGDGRPGPVFRELSRLLRADILGNAGLHTPIG